MYCVKGPPITEVGSQLTFIGCDVLSVQNRSEAATGPSGPGFATPYFGNSLGNVVFKRSRFLLPSEVRLSLLPLTTHPPNLTTSSSCAILSGALSASFTSIMLTGAA